MVKVLNYYASGTLNFIQLSSSLTLEPGLLSFPPVPTQHHVALSIFLKGIWIKLMSNQSHVAGLGPLHRLLSQRFSFSCPARWNRWLPCVLFLGFLSQVIFFLNKKKKKWPYIFNKLGSLEKLYVLFVEFSV